MIALVVLLMLALLSGRPPWDSGNHSGVGLANRLWEEVMK